MPRWLRALRVVHPFPSLLNAALVGLIARTADADAATIAVLTLAMLGMQFAIGSTNDVVDRFLDAAHKPWKPIPAGLVPVRVAATVAIATGISGFLMALLAGLPEVLLWLAMLGCGQAYDLRLKPTPWAWACFSIAFALLPVYAWYGAAGTLPPLWEFVVALALLAGPLLSIGNGLIDLETDAAAGLRTPAVVLGRRRSLAVMTGLLVTIQTAAWVVLGPTALPRSPILLALSSLVGLAALWLSSGAPTARQRGSNLQFLSIASLAAAWLVAVA